MLIFFDFTNDLRNRLFLLDAAIKKARADLSVIWIDAVQIQEKLSEQPISERLFRDITIRGRKKLLDSINQEYPNFVSHNIVIATDGMREVNLDETKEYKQFLTKLIDDEIVTAQKDSFPCEKHTRSRKIYLEALAKTLESQIVELFQEFDREIIQGVYLFNGRFFPEAIVNRYSRARNLPTRFVETFGVDWQNRYWIFDDLVHSASYRSQIMKEFSTQFDKAELSAQGELWFNSRINGVSQTFTRGKNQPFNSQKPQSKLVTFFHSSEDELIVTDLARSDWGNQLEAIRKLTKLLQHFPHFEFVVRVHPNLATKSKRDQRRWRKLQSELEPYGTVFIPFDSSIDSYDLLRKSSIVLTFGSTIGVEAVFHNKTSILLSNSFYEPMDICQKIDTERELLYFLNSFDEDKCKPSRERFGNALIYGAFMQLAGIRVSEFKGALTGTLFYAPRWSFGTVLISTPRVYVLARRIEGRIREILQRSNNCRCDK